MRVFEGSTRVLGKTAIVQLSWKSSKALPTDVGLTWTVRGSNARGVGLWSRSLSYRIVPPSPPQGGARTGRQLGRIDAEILFPFSWYDIYSLTFKADGTYTRWVLADGYFISGLLTESGTHADAATSIWLTDRLATWEPAADDNSHIAPYANVPMADEECLYSLADDNTTLTITENGSELT